MNRTVIGLNLLFWLLTAGRAWTQSEPDVPPPPRPAEEKAGQPAEVYEEVEIFRRLLGRGIADVYGLPATGRPPSNTQGALEALSAARMPGDRHHHFDAPEGVYLKGTGVVYTASLPPPLSPPLPQGAAAGPRGPSPWEQARAELRGEKAAAPAEGGTARQPMLSEAVLRTLAENGRHFRALAGDERITVAFTFRPALACNLCHGGPGDRTPVRGLFESAQRGNGPPPQGPSSRAARPEEEEEAGPVEARRALAMGDLQFKQGRWKEAAVAYQDALAAYRAAGGREKEVHGAAKVRTVLAALEVAQKLARAHNAAGERDTALKFLEAAGQYAREAEALMAARPGGAPPAVPLPARLVISAPRSLLEKVGGGQLTFEEFRKSPLLTVDYLTFRAGPPAGP
jgi:hypothetical protein